jgi:DNA-binding MarR family transcriptional regulator
MKAQETVDYQIKTSWLAISKMYNADAAQFGVTMSIGYVLLNIDIEKGTPATKIAPKLGLEVRSLTRTLKKMEDEGLIERKNDPYDKRMVNIYLTKEGLQKREIAKQAVLNFNQAVKQQVMPEKLKIFFEVIEEINEITSKKELKNTDVDLFE